LVMEAIAAIGNAYIVTCGLTGRPFRLIRSE
jgi:hypothetical protein